MAAPQIARYIGLALIALGVAAIIPMIFALGVNDARAGNYAFGCAASIFSGAGFLLLSDRTSPNLGLRSAIFMALLWWTLAPAYAAIPFWLDGWTIIDGYFEAVSALTTTGATLEKAPLIDKPTDLLWRAILQWIGGAMSLAIAASIFIRPQFVGADAAQPTFSRGEHDSYLHGLASALRALTPIFAAITIFGFLALALSGAPTFDAAVLALSSVSSGGLVPHEAGLEAYPVWSRLCLLPIFCLAGANFVVIDRFVRGRRPPSDSETIAYVSFISILAIALWLLAGGFSSGGLFEPLFNAASLFATSGVVVGQKPGLILALVTVIIGGSAVSTAGGLKVMRWLVIVRRTQIELRKLVSPSAVFGPRSARNELGVWMHFLVFTMALAALAAALTAGGHSLEAAVAGAVGAVANAGPVISLTPEGHAGYFVFKDGWIRLMLAFAMIIGRLEGVAALMLIRGAFWRG